MAFGLRLLGRMGSNAVRVGRVALARFVLPREGRFWLSVKLAPPLGELRAAPLPFGPREPTQALVDLLRTLDAAAGDPRVDGVVLRVAGAPAGLAAAVALRRAVDAVRAAGKPVVAWGERLSLPEYWVASGADRLWLPETGAIHAVGLRAESIHLRGLLDRVGARADVVRVGTHKSAAEALTRHGMSAEHREQVEMLLDDLFGEWVAAVASGRGLSRDAVRDLVDRGPWSAPAAVEAGLADGCLYPDQLDAALAELAPPPPPRRAPRPGAPRVARVEAPVYFRLVVSDPGWRPLLRELPRLAYVVAQGRIHDGPPLAPGISAEGTTALLERLARDDRVRGIVLRVASPGGDALASDLIWRAVRVAAAEKPVVVSMGDVAASGGYFVAAGADAIFAEAPTLTGSIGVVGGKLDLEGVWRRLGIGRDAVERGRRAGLFSDARGFSADERAALRSEMQSIYDVFLRRVGEGRELSRTDVERVAQGRVWSGARARGLRLVDALGGPIEALDEVRRRAGLAARERFLVDVHPQRAPLAGLRALLGVGAALR